MTLITANSKAAFTIGSLLSFTGAIIYGTWTFSTYVNEQKEVTSRIERKLDAAINQQWTRAEHDLFAQKFERLNRKLEVIVPGVNDRS